MAHDTRQRNVPWRQEVKADGTLVRKGACLRPRVDSWNIGYYRESKTRIRELVFSQIELVDDDSLLDTLGAKAIGEIEIKCYTIELPRKVKPSHSSRVPNNTAHKLHEKAKKGIAHCVSAGEIPHELPKKYSWKTKDKAHIGSFIFRYRPLEYLRAQGIAPVDAGQPSHQTRPVETPPSAQSPPGANTNNIKREPTDGLDEDDDDIRALLVKVEEARARKRKNQAMNRSGSKRVKREELPRLASGEIIDLT